MGDSAGLGEALSLGNTARVSPAHPLTDAVKSYERFNLAAESLKAKNELARQKRVDDIAKSINPFDGKTTAWNADRMSKGIAYYSEKAMQYALAGDQQNKTKTLQAGQNFIDGVKADDEGINRFLSAVKDGKIHGGQIPALLQNGNRQEMADYLEANPEMKNVAKFDIKNPDKIGLSGIPIADLGNDYTSILASHAGELPAPELVRRLEGHSAKDKGQDMYQQKFKPEQIQAYAHNYSLNPQNQISTQIQNPGLYNEYYSQHKKEYPEVSENQLRQWTTEQIHVKGMNAGNYVHTSFKAIEPDAKSGSRSESNKSPIIGDTIPIHNDSDAYSIHSNNIRSDIAIGSVPKYKNPILKAINYNQDGTINKDKPTRLISYQDAAKNPNIDILMGGTDEEIAGKKFEDLSAKGKNYTVTTIKAKDLVDDYVTKEGKKVEGTTTPITFKNNQTIDLGGNTYSDKNLRVVHTDGRTFLVTPFNTIQNAQPGATVKKQKDVTYFDITNTEVAGALKNIMGEPEYKKLLDEGAKTARDYKPPAENAQSNGVKKKQPPVSMK